MARIWGPRPADPPYAEVAEVDGWPLVFQDCTATCGRTHQPHEDHGGGLLVCHNCGHHEPRA